MAQTHKMNNFVVIVCIQALQTPTYMVMRKNGHQSLVIGLEYH